MIEDNNTAVGIESFVDVAQPRNAGDTVRESLTNFTQNNATMQSGTVLIEFTVTKPTFARKDKKETADLLQKTGATAKQAANVTKRMFAGCDELRDIDLYVLNRRNDHKAATMRYGNLGYRLTTRAKWFEYHKMMTGYEKVFYEKVDVFVDWYEREHKIIEDWLGTLYDADLYPRTPEKLRDMFKWRLRYPEWEDYGSDDITDMLDSHREMLVDLSAETARAMEQEMQSDFYKRLYDPLKNMCEKLSDVGDKKQTFRDTLIDNVLNIVDIVRASHSLDPEMRSICNDLESTLRPINCDALRDSSYLRSETKTKVDDVRARIEALNTFAM